MSRTAFAKHSHYRAIVLIVRVYNAMLHGADQRNAQHCQYLLTTCLYQSITIIFPLLLTHYGYSGIEYNQEEGPDSGKDHGCVL